MTLEIEEDPGSAPSCDDTIEREPRISYIKKDDQLVVAENNSKLDENISASELTTISSIKEKDVDDLKTKSNQNISSECDVKKCNEENDEKNEQEEPKTEIVINNSNTGNRRRFGLGYFLNLLRGTPKQPKPQLGDAEAGTELLTQNENKSELGASNEKIDDQLTNKGELPVEKDEISKANLSEEKLEKRSDDTDVTLTVTDEKDEANNCVSQPTEKLFTGRFTSPKWKWFLSGCVLFFIVFLLAGFLVAKLTYFPPDDIGEDPQIPPLAITSCGYIRGTKDPLLGVYSFKGIPYARPPIQSLRWKPPQPLSDIEDCWSGTLSAENASSYCPQLAIEGRPDLQFNEDCLYLNVLTPSLSYKNTPLPVVISIGSASLQGLNANDIDWQPEPELAKERNVVFVTFNSRLNVFGFMALEELSKQVYPPTTGNYGVQDQLEALKWVQKNIRNFGGDPEQVTILAHGSAATSALSLVSSSRAKNLFQKVWLTGGSAVFNDADFAEVQNRNKEFLENVGCETIECLYTKTPEDLLSAIPSWWAQETPMDLPNDNEEPGPPVLVVDGTILYDKITNMWEEKNINNVTIVIGATAQESAASDSLPSDSIREWGWPEFSDYVANHTAQFNPNSTAELLEFYIDNSSLPEIQFHTMISDLRVICPLQTLASTLSSLHTEKVYFYVATLLPSSKLIYAHHREDAAMAAHGLDFLAILGHLERHLPSLNALDKAFQDNIQDIFFKFVSSPSSPSSSSSPPSSSDSIHDFELKPADQFVNLISESITVTSAPYKNCRVWDPKDITNFARIN